MEATRTIVERMEEAGAQISFAGAGRTFPSLSEASDGVLKALATAPKDRQYDELRQIVEYLDQVSCAPFTAMSEFEKLKCAGICSLLSVDNAQAVIKRGKAPSAMFLTLRGGVVCFDLSAGFRVFEEKRRYALRELKDIAADNNREPNLDKFTEDWDVRKERMFDHPSRLLDQLEDNELPPETRHWNHNVGSVFGNSMQVFDSEQTDGDQATIVVSNAVSGKQGGVAGEKQQSHFLVLTAENFAQLADVVHQDYQHKVQFLRNVKLMAGVSRLGLKMLAMLLQTVTFTPNTMVIAQDQAPSLMYIITKGFVRAVRHISLKAAPLHHQEHGAKIFRSTEKTPPSHEDERTLATLRGKFLETGLLGTTQFFGAVAVLEGGGKNAMDISLIATLKVSAFTLSRLDLGKISLEDREAMLTNARIIEPNSLVVDDLTIAKQYNEAVAWAGVKTTTLKGAITDRATWRAEVLGNFVSGPPSGCTVRKFKNVQAGPPPQAQHMIPKDHPFRALGSVVLGLY